MIDEKFLTEEEMSTENLMKLTKAELVSHLQGMNDLRLELLENLSETREVITAYNKSRKTLHEQNTELTKQNQTLWRLLEKCLDFEDMLDDLEDTAEEIREAASCLGVDLEEENDTDGED